MRKFQLLAAMVLTVFLMGNLASKAHATDPSVTQSPVIHVTHTSTDSVYFTCTTNWFNVVSGSTGTVSGTLYIQYLDTNSAILATNLVHGYSNPNNGSSLSVGNSFWNTTSAVYSPIDYVTGYNNAYFAVHGTLPPAGQYTYKYKLVVTSTLNDPNFGPITDPNATPVYQNETVTIVR